MAADLAVAWHPAGGEPVEAVCRQGRALFVCGTTDDLPASGPADLTLALGDPITGDAVAPADDGAVLKEGIEIVDGTWRRLTAYADRCLVAATDQSRLTGAGAGLVDTD